METITITFKYNKGDDWNNFWKGQIANRIAYANRDANIQVTTWYADRDCISDLKELEYQQQLNELNGN